MFVIKKQTLIFAIVGLFLTVCLAVGVPVALVTSNTAQSNIIFVIDPGHGGVDGGVEGVQTKVKESDLNLIVSKNLADNFKRAGYGTVLTRTTKGMSNGSKSKNEDFRNRKTIISNSGAKAMVSIHMNKYSSKARRGAQVFYDGSSKEAKLLAKKVQDVLNREINMKYSGREYSSLVGNYYILKCSNIPSVIVECGFLSNPMDEQLLIEEKFQKEMAHHIFSGLMDWYVEKFI